MELQSSLMRLEDVVKYLNEPSAQDKLFRLIIYVCRLFEWGLKKRDAKSSLAVKLKRLDGSFSDTRRVLRVGKLLQVYHTLRSIPAKFWGNPTQMVLEFGKNLSSAAYMANDHGKWIASIGVLDIDGEKYGYRSTCAWFSTIIFAMTLDFIKLYRSFMAERDLLLKLRNIRHHRKTPDDGVQEEAAVTKSLTDLYIARRFIYIELARNGFDTPIAVVGVMKWKSVSNGLLSVFGIISSYLAVYSTWRKIVPWKA